MGKGWKEVDTPDEGCVMDGTVLNSIVSTVSIIRKTKV